MADDAHSPAAVRAELAAEYAPDPVPAEWPRLILLNCPECVARRRRIRRGYPRRWR